MVPGYDTLSEEEFNNHKIKYGIENEFTGNYIEQQSELRNAMGQLHFDLELFSFRGLIDPTFVYEELIPLFAEALANAYNDKNEFVVDLPEYKNIVASLGYQIALLVCRHCETEEHLIKTLKKSPSLFVDHINKIRNFASSQTKSNSYLIDCCQFASRFGVIDDGTEQPFYYRVCEEDLERLNKYCDINEKVSVGREIFTNTKRIANLPIFNKIYLLQRFNASCVTLPK